MYNIIKMMRKTVAMQTKRTNGELIYHVNQKSYSRDIFRIHLCGITYPDKNYEIARGNSSVTCIEYVEKGTGTVHIDGKTFNPCEGDSYILHKGLEQHYYSDKKDPWQKVFVNLSGSLLDSLVEGYNLKDMYCFKGLDIRRELYEITELAKKNQEDHTEDIICIINRIFYKMRESVKDDSHVSEIAEKMKDYLTTHALEKFRIESLCNYVSRSESQTIKIFKEAYGITPYAYVLNKKISLAKGMLVNTNLSVKQIAYNLSFTDEYYFSNVFKNKVGVSPGKYRKTK